MVATSYSYATPFISFYALEGTSMSIGISGSRSLSSSTLSRLNYSLRQQDSTLARLASGSRINRASDDAAGLAVSEALGNRVSVADQAYRNIEDASSALSIADGALSQIQSISGRLQELSMQSANGTYSADQRGAMKSEFDALTQEIQRITSTTEFNGKKLLDGTSISVQVGSDSSASSSLQVGGVNISAAVQNLSNLNIGSQAGAQTALGTLQSFSSSLATQRAEFIGSAQSRLDSVAVQTRSQGLAYREAQSRIRDANVAEDTSQLVRGNIANQVGVSLLAQAGNVTSGLALRLLRS
jgi:flagellin